MCRDGQPTGKTDAQGFGREKATKPLGAFHLAKTSGLNFRQLVVANGTAFSKISKNEDNLTRYT